MFYLINREDHTILVLLQRFGYSEQEALKILGRCLNSWNLSPVAVSHSVATSARIQR